MNLSGHTISITHKPAYEGLPDSLILLNATELPVEMYYIHAHVKKIKRIIYYDGRYKIDIKELPVQFQFANYKYTDGAYTYTFTEADYNYVVEHGTDLEAPVPDRSAWPQH